MLDAQLSGIIDTHLSHADALGLGSPVIHTNHADTEAQAAAIAAAHRRSMSVASSSVHIEVIEETPSQRSLSRSRSRSSAINVQHQLALENAIAAVQAAETSGLNASLSDSIVVYPASDGPAYDAEAVEASRVRARSSTSPSYVDASELYDRDTDAGFAATHLDVEDGPPISTGDDAVVVHNSSLTRGGAEDAEESTNQTTSGGLLPTGEVIPTLLREASAAQAHSEVDHTAVSLPDTHTNTSSTVMRSAQLTQRQPATNAIQNLARIIDITDSEDDDDQDEDAAVSAAISASLLDVNTPRRPSVSAPAASTPQDCAAINTSSEAAGPAAPSSTDRASLGSTSTSTTNQPTLIVGQVFDDEAAFVQASSSAVDASRGATSVIPLGTVTVGQQRQGDLLWVSCGDPLCHASVSSTTAITTDNIKRRRVAAVRLSHRPQCDPRRRSRPSDNYYDDSYDYSDTATSATIPRRSTRSSNSTLAWPVPELASPAAISAPAASSSTAMTSTARTRRRKRAYRDSSSSSSSDDNLHDVGTQASSNSQPTSVMFRDLHQAAARANTRSNAVAAAAQCSDTGGDLVRGATFRLADDLVERATSFLLRDESGLVVERDCESATGVKLLTIRCGRHDECQCNARVVAERRIVTLTGVGTSSAVSPHGTFQWIITDLRRGHRLECDDLNHALQASVMTGSTHPTGNQHGLEMQNTEDRDIQEVEDRDLALALSMSMEVDGRDADSPFYLIENAAADSPGQHDAASAVSPRQTSGLPLQADFASNANGQSVRVRRSPTAEALESAILLSAQTQSLASAAPQTVTGTSGEVGLPDLDTHLESTASPSSTQRPSADATTSTADIAAINAFSALDTLPQHGAQLLASRPNLDPIPAGQVPSTTPATAADNAPESRLPDMSEARGPSTWQPASSRDVAPTSALQQEVDWLQSIFGAGSSGMRRSPAFVQAQASGSGTRGAPMREHTVESSIGDRDRTLTPATAALIPAVPILHPDRDASDGPQQILRDRASLENFTAQVLQVAPHQLERFTSANDVAQKDLTIRCRGCVEAGHHTSGHSTGALVQAQRVGDVWHIQHMRQVHLRYCVREAQTGQWSSLDRSSSSPTRELDYATSSFLDGSSARELAQAAGSHVATAAELPIHAAATSTATTAPKKEEADDTGVLLNDSNINMAIDDADLPDGDYMSSQEEHHAAEAMDVNYTGSGKRQKLSGRSARNGSRGGDSSDDASQSTDHSSSRGGKRATRARAPRVGDRFDTANAFQAAVISHSGSIQADAVIAPKLSTRTALEFGCVWPECPYSVQGELLRNGADQVRMVEVIRAMTRHARECNVHRVPSAQSLPLASDAIDVPTAPNNMEAPPRPTSGVVRGKRRRGVANDAEHTPVGLTRTVSSTSFVSATSTQQENSPELPSLGSATATAAASVTQRVFSRSPALRRTVPRTSAAPSIGDVYDSGPVLEDALKQSQPDKHISGRHDARGWTYLCTTSGCAYRVRAELVTPEESELRISHSRTHHSQECNGLSSTATTTIPKIKSSYDDWDDFVDQVKRHSHSVNPGSAPSLKISTVSAIDHANADRGRVFCPHRDSGCQYGFTVEFAISGGLHCGRVKVIKSKDRHSDACKEYCGMLFRRNEEVLRPSGTASAAQFLPPNLAASRDASENHQLRAQVGDRLTPGNIFESDSEFRAAVEAFSQRINPGSCLNWRKTARNLRCGCNSYHAGCRFEFHAAYFKDPKGNMRLNLTDIVPQHSESCERELLLTGRRKLKVVDGASDARRTRSRGAPLRLAVESSASDPDTSTVDASRRPHTSSRRVRRRIQQSQDQATTPHRSVSVLEGLGNAVMAAQQPDASVRATPDAMQSLANLDVPDGPLQLLNGMGYSTLQELLDAGITQEDWPTLLLQLERVSQRYPDGLPQEHAGFDLVRQFVIDRRCNDALQAHALSSSYTRRPNRPR